MLLLDSLGWNKNKAAHLSLPYKHCLVTQHPYLQLRQQQLEAEMKFTLGRYRSGTARTLKFKSINPEEERPALEKSLIQVTVAPWQTAY